MLLTRANDKESSWALPSGRESHEREERDSEERGEDEQEPGSGAAGAVRARPTGAGERVRRCHSGRGGRTARARSLRTVRSASSNRERAGVSRARRRLRGRRRAGYDRDPCEGRLEGSVVTSGTRALCGPCVRASDPTSGAAALDRGRRHAGDVCGLARGGSDGWSGDRSGRRQARGRHARRRGARRRRRRGSRRRCRRRRRGGLWRGAGSRCRCQSRSGRWRWSRWDGRRCRTRREQRGGIDVCVAVATPDAEVDVRRVVLGVARRPGGGDRRPLGHDVSAAYGQRAEVRQRGLVPVARRDGHGEPVGGHGPGEGDLAGCGRTHAGCVPERDVDSSMLPACVRVVAEREPSQDRPVRRPTPGGGLGGPRERADEHGRRQEHPRCR